ncbi:MAG: hypothetical protein IPM56_17580 [Ignavibacteriales bacterium]|nr:MAG: hypothetical protein IPM56_17580 [Ignavibacteriales bacterium]
MNRITFFKLVIGMASLFFIVAGSVSSAQTYDDLVPLDGYKTKIYFSAGNDVRAKIVAERMDHVLEFYNKLIAFEPEVTLLIMNPVDWPRHTTFPVYGMPHYDEKRNLLIIASENNEFWKSFIPPVDQFPKELADKISSTYIDENGGLSMQAFFDLLAIHELGHAYQFQAGLNVQRMWMGELFCNILLHTYIAENEPEQLPALTVFPQMVIAGGTEGFVYTSLSDIEERYEEIGQRHPRNYGWYQCRWHYAAGNIYDAGGTETFVKLWNALLLQKEKLDDSKFAELLSEQTHQSVADVMLKWDE